MKYFKLYYIIGYMCLCHPNAAKGSGPVGTPERIENEYKFAFRMDDSFEIHQILADLQFRMSEWQKKMPFELPQIINSQYVIEPQFSIFVFKDIYLDTPGMAVLNDRSSYRLRYRWNKLAHYSRHLLFPFLKPFFPTRCEIQYKRNYEIDQTNRMASVHESRFEFRNESEPFIVDQSAPPAPWNEAEYLVYAKTGYFKSHRMLPSHLLFENVGFRSDLGPAVTVETARFRTHMNFIGNPWSWGANPDQAFIITFDVSSWTYADGTPGGQRFLEVEIEVDRNIMTMLRVVAEMEAETKLQKLAKQNSIQALYAIEKDQKTLSQFLNYAIKSYNIGDQLETNYKYARIMKLRGRL